MNINKKTVNFILSILILLLIINIIACGNTETNENSTNKLTEALHTKSKQELEATSKNTSIINNSNQSQYRPNDIIMELQTSLREIAERSIPAVVNIRSEIKIEGTNPFNYKNIIPPELRKFFGQPDNQEGNPYSQQALGSGFIISDDGYIITNNHVIKGATKVTILLSDDRELEAKIIGTDEKTDTALLKVESDEKLPSVSLGDSDTIQVGDIAIAIGNPFGLKGTFTMGVISAKGRSNSTIDRDATFKDYIQTDASINQGNSGGPLLNIYGEVIGMNTAIYSTSGGSIGIGFAVPINIVKRIVEDLADDGVVERPMLGLTVSDLDIDTAKVYGINVKEGAFVNDVLDDSPASKANIRPMDIIIQIDNVKITSAEDVVRKVISYKVGDSITLKILRLKNQTETETITTNVRLGLRDEDKFLNIHTNNPNQDPKQENGKTKEWMKMTLGNVYDYKSQMQTNDDIEDGVIVLEVAENSNAYENNIRKGFIITAINGEKINNIDDLSKIKDVGLYMLRVYVEGNYGRIIITK